MTKTPTLAVLTAQEQAALEAYEQAQAAARAAQQASDQRRAAALADYDRGIVADFDEEASKQAINEAKQRLHDAVIADPVMLALRDLYAAQLTAWHRHQEAASAASRVGITFEAGSAQVAPPPAIEPILTMLELDALNLVEDHNETREAARTAAGEAKA